MIKNLTFYVVLALTFILVLLNGLELINWYNEGREQPKLNIVTK